MSKMEECPKCGSQLTPDAPLGMCPVCLLQQGVDRIPKPGGNHAVVDGKFVPPTIERLNEIFPQFEFLTLVGQGGMGAVYRVRQKLLDRIVAVKILPPAVGHDPTFAERFSREAKAMARLTHPNILSIYEFGETNGQYFLVMEYVDGVSLRQAIQAKSQSPAASLGIVRQVCEALQFAHDEGIVHRDIKPENILVDQKGRVKIADFGLAKLLSRSPVDITLTAAHQILGTLHYMAPEQMEHPLDVDHRADIYSLGVVFYELLTGQLPVGRFPLPSTLVGIEQRLDEVVLRTLERDPGNRYQHASDVQCDVEKYSLESTNFSSPNSSVAPSEIGKPLDDCSELSKAAAKSDRLWSVVMSTMNPGLLAFGVAIALAGTLLLILGISIENKEYFWSGLGSIIAAGAIASVTWVKSRPDLGVNSFSEPGRLVFGVIACLMGLVVFFVGASRNENSMVWAGFGLTVLSGAIAQSAWKKAEDEQANRSEADEQVAPQSPRPMNEALSNRDAKHFRHLNIVAAVLLSATAVVAQERQEVSPQTKTNEATAGDPSRTGGVEPSRLAVDEGNYININGVEQWVTIRGHDLSNPVLLFLHGGPGIGNAAMAPAYSDWERSFTLVQWDQPASGFTHMKNPEKQGEMTVARYTKDGIAVTEHVLKRLKKDRLVVMGHSWGTLIGLEMIKARPELYSAYVGTSQAVGDAGNKLGYELALKAARERKDTAAIVELERVGPPPYTKFEDFLTRQKYSNPPAYPQSDAEKAKTADFLGILATPPSKDAKYTPSRLLKPEQMNQDPQNTWINFVEVQKALFRETWSWEARSLGNNFRLPIFVYQGALDINTPAQPVREWIEEIQSPIKGFELLPESGHNTIVFHQELLTLINRDVRPLVIEKSTSK